MFLPSGNLQIGGYTYTPSEMAALVLLYGRVSTSGRATTMRLPTGSAGYTTTGGGLRLKHIGVICDVATAQVAAGYGDTDVGVNSASAPTNPVYVAGDSTPILLGSSQNIAFSSPLLNFLLIAGKLPFMVCSGTSVSAIFYCVQE